MHVGRIPDLRNTRTGPGPLGKKTWKVHTKQQLKAMPDGTQGVNWLTENAIRFHWRKRTEDVVFWQKGSMWMCCAGGERMSPYIMFNRELKEMAIHVASLLFGPGRAFDAVHVRRADGHTRIDRRTAKHYIERHLVPAKMNGSLPLYVATDEKKKEWFDPIRGVYRDVRFWSDVAALRDARVERFLESYPVRMRSDVVGFLEQLLCVRADKWQGSDGSTFSAAISAMRKFALPMKDPEWERLIESRPRLRKVYASDGEGVGEEEDVER